jgi:DNA-binding SARP family transcriptional activator
VISGRRTPRLPLARLRTHGELAQLTTDDLRFSPEETDRLFRESYRRPLAPDVVEALCHRTEGWAASLQLVEAATRERTAAETRTFINGLSGEKAHLYDYLAEEVVGVLEPALQRFLMHAAVLQRVEPELAAVAAEVPVEEAQRALEAAGQAGLLPSPDADARPQRFHPLVAEFLLSRLASEIGPAGVAEVHRRVARHLEASDWRLACHHYAAAGDHGAARVVAEGALQDIMASGDYAFAERYLSENGEYESAALEIVRSRIDFNQNDLNGALARARLAASNAPLPLRDAACANLMTLTLAAGDFREARGLAQSLRATSDPHYRWLADGMLSAIDACRGALGLDAAAAVMERMAAVQRAKGMPRYLGITLNNLMTLLRPMGRHSALLSYAGEAERSLTVGGAAPEVANVMVLRAWAEAHIGRTSEAREHADLARQTSHLATRADVLIQAAELAIALGDELEAVQCLDEAEPLCGRVQPSLGMWRSARLWLLLRRRDADGAAREASELRDELTYNPGQRSMTAALTAHLAYLRGDPNARQKLQQALAVAQSQAASYWASYCLLLMAALDGPDLLNMRIAKLGGEDQVLVSVLAEVVADHLQELDDSAAAVVQAQAEIHPVRWRPVLRRTIDLGDPARQLAAARILDRIGTTDDVPRLRSLARSLRGPHADPQLGRGLAKRLAIPAFVEDLGSVEIRVGERVIHGSEVRRRPLALLCFLLSRPDWRATRDQVVDALWPDNEPNDAVNSLNQTLYFLRRLIDPAYKEDVAPAYILNSGEVVWLDADLIESRSRRVRKLIDELGRNLDLARVDDLLSEYRGQFALDFTYEEWALGYRDSLHASFLEVAERAIRVAIGKGAHAEGIKIARRVLEIDPDADQIELELVRLYRLSGASLAAAEQYAHYAATVRRELGIEPPPLDSL